MLDELNNAVKGLVDAIELATQGVRKVNISVTNIEGRMDQIVERLKMSDAERKAWSSALDEANGKIEDAGRAISKASSELDDIDTTTVDEPEVK